MFKKFGVVPPKGAPGRAEIHQAREVGSLSPLRRSSFEVEGESRTLAPEDAIPRRKSDVIGDGKLYIKALPITVIRP
jgi:hypothetical protein